MAPWREHPTTSDLLRYLDEKVKRAGGHDAWIASHLEQCAFCSDLLAEMSAFEEALGETDEGALRLEAAGLVRHALEAQVVGPRVIPLELVNTSDTDEHWFASSLPLAARSGGSGRRSVTHISTMRSKDGRIYLRLLRDASRGAVLAHLICQQPEAGKWVVISLDSPDVVSLTDDNGFARFPLAGLPMDETTTVSVHPATATLRLSREQLASLRSRGGMELAGCSVRVDEGGGENEAFAFTASGEKLVHLVALLPPGAPAKLLRLPARIRTADFVPDTDIKFFSLPA